MSHMIRQMRRGKWIAIVIFALVWHVLAARALPVRAQIDDTDAEDVIVTVQAGHDIGAIAAAVNAQIVSQIPGTDRYRLRATRPSAALVDRLSHQPGIVAVEPNYRVMLVDAQQFSLAFSGQFALPGPAQQALYESQWAVTRLGLPIAHARGATGAGVVIAIVDTGVNGDHPALAGRVLAGWDFVDGDPTPTDLPAGIDANGNGIVDEAAGHGTFLAGLVTLVAPDARILPMRVLNSDGQGTIYDVAAGIHAAVDAGAQIVDLSLGTDHNSATLAEAIAYAQRHGAIVVAAAGNRSLTTNRSSTVLYPARYPEVIAVGATDSDDHLATFSTWGKELDFVAPGVTVYSTYLNDGYAWWSGTSMAAAFTCGAAAVVLGQHPTWTAAEVENRLQATAVDVSALNLKQLRDKLGAGRINVDAATRE